MKAKVVKSISIVLPVHLLADKEEKKMFLNALKSISNQKERQLEKVIIVYSKAVAPQIIKMKKTIAEMGIPEVVYVENNTEDTTFQAQVNLGVEHVTTEWFTVLEFDDELTDIYTKYVSQYTSAYEKKSEVSMLVPIVANVNTKGELIKYSNEVLWVNEFSDVLGHLTHKSLKDYEDINLTGCVIRTAVFKEVGMLKASMKVSFNHEFLLRMTQYDYCGVSVPKVLYLHNIERENSLFRSYIKAETALSSEEVMFWFDLAKSEYVFKEDRKATFTATATAQ